MTIRNVRLAMPYLVLDQKALALLFNFQSLARSSA